MRIDGDLVVTLGSSLRGSGSATVLCGERVDCDNRLSAVVWLVSGAEFCTGFDGPSGSGNPKKLHKLAIKTLHKSRSSKKSLGELLSDCDVVSVTVG